MNKKFKLIYPLPIKVFFTLIPKQFLSAVLALVLCVIPQTAYKPNRNNQNQI